jgi:hypothetical protein
LDPEEQTAVNRDGKFRVSLYKALLFLHVKNGIKSGALNLEHSYKYRPLDDYLIDRDRWQRAKQQLIERAGLEGFVDPWKTLKELDEALYQQYLLTNRNIAEGKNPHIKFIASVSRLIGGLDRVTVITACAGFIVGHAVLFPWLRQTADARRTDRERQHHCGEIDVADGSER